MKPQSQTSRWAWNTQLGVKIEYLGESEILFENILICLSGAQMWLTDEEGEKL